MSADPRPAPERRSPASPGHVVAILTAAGSGTRLGHSLPKALADLGGDPLIVHALRGLLDSGVVDGLVVTAPAAWTGRVRDVVAREAPTRPWTVVPGGASRQASVAAGLEAVADLGPDIRPGHVLVHDAARALTPPGLVLSVVRALRDGRAAVIPGLAVTDALKRVGPGAQGATGALPVEGAVDRASLRAVQTPQGFDHDLLARAHAAASGRRDDESVAAPDDAALVEALGETVWVVPGAPEALKVTTPFDLAVAELLLRRRDGHRDAGDVGRAADAHEGAV